MKLRFGTRESSSLALVLGVSAVLGSASACGRDANDRDSTIAPFASAVVSVQQDSLRLAEAVGVAALDEADKDDTETPEVRVLPLDAESLASLLSDRVPGYNAGPTKSGIREIRGAMTSFVERNYRGKGRRQFSLQLHDLRARLSAPDFEIPVAGVEGVKAAAGITVGELDGVPFQWRSDARGRRGELRLWIKERFLVVLKSDRLSQAQASAAGLASLNRENIAKTEL